jgi:hypothetical protein
VTSVEESSERRSDSSDASVDDTDARNGGVANVAEPLRENGGIPTPLAIWISACVR